jgi:DNA-binding CsgD family transcriptional regulator
VFFCTPDQQELVAEGTSVTPMGQREEALGLDRLPMHDGGRMAHVFQTGESYRTNDAREDDLERHDIVYKLGVRSTLAAPFDVNGVRHGVVLTSSARLAAFSERDLAFLEVIARWIGITADRFAEVRHLAAQAALYGLQEGVTAQELTARQLEVTALVRQGLTNAEIAQRLVVEAGTVANHVAHILDRLGFRSRSQLAAWAAERRIGGHGDDG